MVPGSFRIFPTRFKQNKLIAVSQNSGTLASSLGAEVRLARMGGMSDVGEQTLQVEYHLGQDCARPRKYRDNETMVS